jgi:hypothetical protein
MRSARSASRMEVLEVEGKEEGMVWGCEEPRWPSFRAVVERVESAERVVVVEVGVPLESVRGCLLGWRGRGELTASHSAC